MAKLGEKSPSIIVFRLFSKDFRPDAENDFVFMVHFDI
jgi:hypothetical protein